MASTMSSGRTVLDAASNEAVLGSSAVHLPPSPEPTEQLQRALDGDVAIGIETDRELSDPGLATSPGGVKRIDDMPLGFNGNQQVGLLSGELDLIVRPRRQCPA